MKIPRLPFDKFITAKRTLTTQMKATGEVMSICNNFEGALMKAIRSLEQHVDSLLSYDFSKLSDEELQEQLHVVDDRRIWVIAEALRRGVSYDEIHEITKIDKWFIDKLAILVEMEQDLKTKPLTVELLKEAKRMEFPDKVIADLTGKSEKEIHDMRYENGIVAAFKMVDTCAAEFEASTPYYYSVFGSENEATETTPKKKVLVLGSGPIRIGQGIEFDYCSVHSTWAFAKEGWETVIVNNNPETVSTDFDIADKLPILIAEKTGPHFAVGDTCYSQAEDTPVYNPDGKEIVARDNEISILRKEDESKAYFNCHTDITIPYDELDCIYIERADGSTGDIIRDGRFVVPGTEKLNEPLENKTSFPA